MEIKNEYTLDKIGSFEKNYSFSRAIEGEGEYHHIHYGDIHTKLPTYIEDADLLPTITKVQNFETLDYGDILIADASEDYKDLGKAVCFLDMTNNKVIAGLHTHRFKPNKDLVIPEYLINLFQTHRYRKYVWKMGTGVSVLGLSKTNIAKYTFNVPSLETQEIVSKHFIRLNKKIQLQQEKIDLLKQQKKGFMQKIFSQELRFKDDNGQEFPEWERVQLKHIADSISYGMNAAAKPFDNTNIYLRITDIDDETRQFIEETKVSPDSRLDQKYLLNEGDILFTRTGASVGKSFYFTNESRPTYFAGFLIRVRLFKNVNSNFVYQNTLTTEYEKWIKVMSMRSGQPGVNGKEYGTWKLNLPCIDEQNIISEFLSLFDKKINLELQYIQQLYTQKQAFMQQMFI